MARRAWRGGVLVTLVCVLWATACAREASERVLTAPSDAVDRTPAAPGGPGSVEDLLAETVDRAAAQSLRYEVFLSPVDGVELPIGEGRQDAGRYSVRMDIGALRGRPSNSSDPGEDLGAYLVGDDRTLYLRTPLAALRQGESLPPNTSPLAEVLMGLGDGWGRLDLTVLDDVGPGLLAGFLGPGQAVDPVAVLNAAMADNGDVGPLGESTVDGDLVRGLSTSISLAGLLTTQGVDIEAYVDLVVGTSGTAQDDVEELLAEPRPLEVWIDDDSLIRRLVLTMETLGAAPGASQHFDLVYEFSDHGEPMDIEFPPDAEVIDITEDFADALGG